MDNIGVLPAFFETILCPIDFEPNSIAALEMAAKLARIGSTIWVLHVAPVQASPEFSVVPADPGHGAESRLCQIVRERLDDRIIPYETVSRIGDPAHEIVSLAEEIDADIVVMATHGYTGTLRVLIGSVCDRVMQELTRPLLVVRPQLGAIASDEHADGCARTPPSAGD